jgi:hypothetical protein
MKSLIDHCCRLGTLFSLQFGAKYFLNLEQRFENFLGNMPKSSIIWAI